MATSYKPLRSDDDPLGQRPLPLKKKVAIYSRVSTNAQIGNESSRIQTGGMLQRLRKWGYPDENITMIDMDEGISGTKGPDERPGMKTLYELIQSGEYGAIATEHASRFFRDQKMIDANIFIEVCRQFDVRLIIGERLYDVNHPITGPYDIRAIRQSFEDSAKYLEEHIYNTLLNARHSVGMRGEYDGRPVAPGYMIDMRPKVNDADNPNFRKPVIYECEAEVVREWFRLFLENKGNLSATWRHIRKHGPYLPDRDTAEIQIGFSLSRFQYKRDPQTGHITPSRNALENLFTNITYYGGWRYSDRAVILDNHEPLVDRELFMAVFNMLSRVDFFGEPNPHYRPQRTWTRHDKAERTAPKPVYYGLIVSNDVAGKPHKSVSSTYSGTAKTYEYILSRGHTEGAEWCIKCEQADAEIDMLLLKRIQLTQTDEAAFKEALASIERGDNRALSRLEQDIQAEEALKQRLSVSLATLDNPTLIQDVQSRYEAACARLVTFKSQLEAVQAQENQAAHMETLPQILETVVANWSNIEPEMRRNLMVELAQTIEITKTGTLTKRIIVHWKDGSRSMVDIRNLGRGRAWTKEELQQLKQMVESGVDQAEILRQFPDHKWRNLMQQYGNHFNNESRKGVYHGQMKYSQDIRWEQTEEYRQMKREENGTSSNPPMTAGTRRQFSPLDWFDLTEPRVFEVLRAMSGE